VPVQEHVVIRKPSSVAEVGSFSSKAMGGSVGCVDVVVVMPEGFLVPKAHINYRYHARRAVYLVAIARVLRDASYSLYGDQLLHALHDDPARPVLLMRPAKAGGVCIRLLPVPPADAFALPRLAPDRNGVRSCTRPQGVAGSAPAANGSEEPAKNGSDAVAGLLPTPYYNNAIMEDMLAPALAKEMTASLEGLAVFGNARSRRRLLRAKLLVQFFPQGFLSAHACLRDALLLLKLWARQHGLMASEQGTTSSDGGDPASCSSAAAAAGVEGWSGGAGGCLDGTLLAGLVALMAQRNPLVGDHSGQGDGAAACGAAGPQLGGFTGLCRCGSPQRSYRRHYTATRAGGSYELAASISGIAGAARGCGRVVARFGACARPLSSGRVRQGGSGCSAAAHGALSCLTRAGTGTG
jgi:U3 small nucleolar RNA-associated protein 22